jgi:hypothetical protein
MALVITVSVLLALLITWLLVLWAFSRKNTREPNDAWTRTERTSPRQATHQAPQEAPLTHP